MEITQLFSRALEIRKQYSEFEKLKYGRSWTNEELALGFVGDVGDLAKLVQSMNGIRNIPEARQKLAHELSDCLWSIIVLADQFGIDIETAFMSAMDAEEKWIQQKSLIDA